MTQDQREKLEALAKSFVPIGNGRVLVESTFKAGYGTRLNEEAHEKSVNKERDRRVKLAIDAMSVFGFIMLFIVCFGQLPIEKAITHVTTSYAKEATHQATVKVCNVIDSQKQVYASSFEDVFTRGCIWNMEKVLLFNAKTSKDKNDIQADFQNKNSKYYTQTYDFCLGAAVDKYVRGEYEERIASDLWDRMECQNLYNGSDR